jgi:DNA replication protein
MNTTTLQKMQQMKLTGMYRAFKTNVETEDTTVFTNDEIIAHLIDAEWDERQNRRIEHKIKNARFRYKAAVEDLYYHYERNMDKNQILRFTDGSFIDKGECILITGSTGIGKSYLASALGYHACSLGYSVIYYSVPKLFTRLKMSKADGSYLKEMTKIERKQLLILDDFGLQPMDAFARTALMEIMEDRHNKGAVIITSQIPVSKWYEIIGEQTIADAILDRIVHQAHRLELKGESLRKKRSTELQNSI